jgi:hypothetical protein
LGAAGTPRGQPPSPGSSAFRAVVTKGTRTAEKALDSSQGLQEAVLQDRHEGSGTQQRDGALQSGTESSAEGIADLHRVTLAVGVICQVRGRLHHLGSDPSRAGRRHTHTGRRWPDRRSCQPRPSRHDTPSGLAVASRRTTGLPLLGSAALGQAKRSEEIHGTAANQWQPAQVANRAGRNGDIQDRRRPDPPGRVRPGAARGRAVRRLQVPAPHMTKVGDSCTVRFPKASAYPFFCQVHYAQGMKGVITVGSGGAPGGRPPPPPVRPAATLPWSPRRRRRCPDRPASRPSTEPSGARSPSAPCSRWCGRLRRGGRRAGASQHGAGRPGR